MNVKSLKAAAFILFAALFATNANAQSIKYPKMHFGIRVGGSFNSASHSTTKYFDEEIKLNGKTSPTGGFALDFRIASIPLYLETGAYFVNRTVTVADADVDINDLTGQVPLLLSYHYYISDNTAIQPFAGGYMSYGHKFIPGVRFGVGINYGRLYANVGYDIDLGEREGNKSRFGDFRFKSPGIFATIGYNFGGSR